MDIDPADHHESCPLCGQQFIGFTDADMVEHLALNHQHEFKEYLDLPEKERVECDTCGKEYTTHMGECPFCRNGGPPYK